MGGAKYTPAYCTKDLQAIGVVLGLEHLEQVAALLAVAERRYDLSILYATLRDVVDKMSVRLRMASYGSQNDGREGWVVGG